ncbi:MAG: hypothetical protein ABIA12_00210 [Candidatus Aenigmatarchaeota archaeon]
MDENKSIWDSIRPKWRDVVYACMGMVGGAFTATRLPKYFEGVMDGYQRKQAKLIAEELRKPNEPYKTEN